MLAELRAARSHAVGVYALRRADWMIMARVLSDECRLVELATQQEVRAAVRVGAILTLMVGAVDSKGYSLAPLVVDIRADGSRIPIAAVCRLDSKDANNLVGLIHAGVDGILLSGSDDFASSLRRRVRECERNSVAKVVYRRVESELPTNLRALARFAADAGGEDFSVERAAQVIGIDRKTLLNRMRTIGRLEPRVFINRVRLTVAVGLIERTARPTETIAHELGFASAAAFRNMLARYSGRKTGDIRGGRMFEEMLDELVLEIRTSRHTQ
ncbi:MAG: AraC family transcriptional regulator [Gemmatimonadaceae bacterium]|nr:AraC family transcriptional regulator [Gemmatimonadaceae bacterium]